MKTHMRSCLSPCLIMASFLVKCSTLNFAANAAVAMKRQCMRTRGCQCVGMHVAMLLRCAARRESCTKCKCGEWLDESELGHALLTSQRLSLDVAEHDRFGPHHLDYLLWRDVWVAIREKERMVIERG